MRNVSRMAQTIIERHVKVRGEPTPYDPIHVECSAKRSEARVCFDCKNKSGALAVGVKEAVTLAVRDQFGDAVNVFFFNEGPGSFSARQSPLSAR